MQAKVRTALTAAIVTRQRKDQRYFRRRRYPLVQRSGLAPGDRCVEKPRASSEEKQLPPTSRQATRHAPRCWSHRLLIADRSVTWRDLYGGTSAQHVQDALRILKKAPVEPTIMRAP